MTNHFTNAESFTSKNALVVDDGPVERMAGRAMLERLGFHVNTASDGEEALLSLKNFPADLILCDISMPKMDGLTLLETTRSQARPPPFIMFTSHNDAEQAFASLRLGAYGYLTKPLRFEPLRDTVHDVMTRHSEEQNTLLEKRELARRDALTNLMNKIEFSRCLDEKLQANTPGALLLIKIHGMNHLNQSYGRLEGDHALRAAATELARLLRSDDLLARFNGDVFAVYFDGISSLKVEERAVDVIKRIEDAKIVLAGDAFGLSLIVGGACTESGMQTESLLSRADFALHLARDQSRNRLHIYTDADQIHRQAMSHQLNILAIVRSALADDRIVMAYQPIVDLKNGQLSHFEALLRIADDNGKPCNTGELVKTCEVFGLIGRLDRAVVATCLNDVAKLPAGSGMAINLSGKSIGDPDLLSFIETRIKDLEIDPARIIFELTETAAFYNLDEVRHFVSRIKNLGCRFALDDFGVGFSSFYYIKQLDFDYLKIDGSFIAHLPDNLNDQVFVRAMVEISRVFGLTVIAEWVEDKATADLLLEYGVALGQGYHYGKPAALPE